MKRPKVLHVDENHPILIDGLEKLGFENIIEYETPLREIIKMINQYDGIVIRSRFTIDKLILKAAKRIKFIARVGSGLENIDVEYAKSKKIHFDALNVALKSIKFEQISFKDHVNIYDGLPTLEKLKILK